VNQPKSGTSMDDMKEMMKSLASNILSIQQNMMQFQ
jgi:hypothetical protein